MKILRKIILAICLLLNGIGIILLASDLLPVGGVSIDFSTKMEQPIVFYKVVPSEPIGISAHVVGIIFIVLGLILYGVQRLFRNKYT